MSDEPVGDNESANQAVPPPYVAIICLSLPASQQKVTANVILTPLDGITAAGQFKPLPECTLADLQVYAHQLEEESWQTFHSIKLSEINQHEHIHVDLRVLDAAGQDVPPSRDWLSTFAVVTFDDGDKPSTSEAGAAVPAPATAAPEPAVYDDLAEANHSAPEPLPQIIVAESEPVIVERQATSPAEIEPDIIAPSQARVRIAGRPFSAGTADDLAGNAAAAVLIDEPALRAAQAHALSSPNQEVAGVLIGPIPEKQPDGRYIVHIIDTIIAKYTVMSGASVTYTPESWRYMSDKLRERYPDETAVIVGWYHTHPGFGIFLSGMDLFIHQNFFTQPWHVALVLDPRARTSGFFCWDRQQTRVAAYDFPWPAWAASSW